jgi:hypothetical protein
MSNQRININLDNGLFGMGSDRPHCLQNELGGDRGYFLNHLIYCHHFPVNLLTFRNKIVCPFAEQGTQEDGEQAGQLKPTPNHFVGADSVFRAEGAVERSPNLINRVPIFTSLLIANQQRRPSGLSRKSEAIHDSKFLSRNVSIAALKRCRSI